MADLPGCLAEWERNLRRLVDEGIEAPSDQKKRLALLKMLPEKVREKLWDTADELYPSFAKLLGKVQKMVQDDLDAKHNPTPMDVDALGDEGGEWKETGQTFAGKAQKEKRCYLHYNVVVQL